MSWFESYLRGRSQYVSLSNYDSDFEPVVYGVPQGSILRSLPFIFYISDPLLLTKHTYICMYTDDTGFYKSSVLHLEHGLNLELSIVNTHGVFRTGYL